MVSMSGLHPSLEQMYSIIRGSSLLNFMYMIEIHKTHRYHHFPFTFTISFHIEVLDMAQWRPLLEFLRVYRQETSFILMRMVMSIILRVCLMIVERLWGIWIEIRPLRSASATKKCSQLDLWCASWDEKCTSRLTEGCSMHPRSFFGS